MYCLWINQKIRVNYCGHLVGGTNFRVLEQPPERTLLELRIGYGIRRANENESFLRRKLD
jgi:hypothetical protein